MKTIMVILAIFLLSYSYLYSDKLSCSFCGEDKDLSKAFDKVKLGEYAKAVEILEIAIKTPNKDLSERCYYLAYCYELSGKKEKSIMYYNKVLEYNSNNYLIKRSKERINVLTECKNFITSNTINDDFDQSFVQARELYNKIEELQKTRWSYKNIKKYDEIIESCDKLSKKYIGKGEETGKIYDLLVNCYDKQANYSKRNQSLQKYYDQLFKLYGDKKAFEELFFVAKSKYDNAEYDNAIIIYKIGLNIFKDNNEIGLIATNIALCYKKLNKIQEMQQTYLDIVSNGNLDNSFREKAMWEYCEAEYMHFKKSVTINNLKSSIEIVKDPFLQNIARVYIVKSYMFAKMNKEAIEEFKILKGLNSKSIDLNIERMINIMQIQLEDKL